MSSTIKLHDDIYIIKNFYKSYNKLYDHILSNKMGYRSHNPDCVIRYQFDINSSIYSKEFPNLILDYNIDIQKKIYNIFNIKTKEKNTLTAIIYPEDCSMQEHTDNYDPLYNPNAKASHIISSVHYLNSSFTGGQLIFKNLNITIKPEENLLVIFNPNLLHSSSINKNGAKISLVNFWEEG